MKYLGIDYGEAKVGLALSDPQGVLAFPFGVISNTDALVREIAHIVTDERVDTIVVGDGRTYSGAENKVSHQIGKFAGALRKVVSAPVVLATESGSTGAASTALRGEGAHRGSVQSPRRIERGAPDAHAAAIILQRYVDAHR